jgi:hypothetical protein
MQPHTHDVRGHAPHSCRRRRGRAATRLMMRDEARRIAANKIVELPGLLLGRGIVRRGRAHEHESD